MRLKPKHLGDELTLDEFNAIQHLLYNMRFTDMLYLDPGNIVEKTWAQYTYQEHPKLVLGKYDTYELNQQLTSSDNHLKIQLTNEINPNSTYYATIYYSESETIDSNDFSSKDIPEVMDELRRPILNEDKEFKSLIMQCSKEEEGNNTYLIIPLINGTEGLVKEETLLSRKVKLEIRFNEENYIDINNGKANQSDEILIDDISKLELMIKNHPTDNEKAIYRLDANKYYTPNSTLIIKNGMNIEIRGGTNGGTVTNDSSKRVNIDSSNCGRLFIIKPGGKLVLRDVQLINGNSKQSTYKKGYGGTILVEKDDNRFGQLESINTIYKDSTSDYGGAIYSEHAGIYLDTCRFTNCTSTTTGGAITYISESIIITFPNVSGKRGDTITLKVTVKEEDNELVDQGKVHFYIGETEIGTGTVVNGVATIQYKIPDTLSTSEQIITALYDGGETNETTYIQASLFIKDPTILSFTMDNITVPHVGTTVRLEVTSKDQNGNNNTTGRGVFTIDGTEYEATISNNKYILDFPIPELGYKKEYQVTFKVSDKLCTPITRTITVIEKDITGVFVNKMTITQSNINTWVNNGVTDIFVRCNDYDSSSSRSTLESVLKYSKNTDLRIHATISCYRDMNQGVFTGITDERTNWIKNQIGKIIDNTNCIGINLDYFRYAGTDGPNDSKHTNITNRLKEIKSFIQNKNKNFLVSVCVMPEMDINSTYYGQNYKELCEYADYMMPMVYKGNYGSNGQDASDSWVQRVALYIANEVEDTEKVIPILQTYTNDDDLQTAINTKDQSKINKELRTVSNLEATMKVIAPTNMKGITLFREGLILKYPRSLKQIQEELNG